MRNIATQPANGYNLNVHGVSLSPLVGMLAATPAGAPRIHTKATHESNDVFLANHKEQTMNNKKHNDLPDNSENIFSEGIHICHIYNDDNERARTMAKFFEKGLAEGNKILCIVDTASPSDIKGELVNLGVDANLLESDFVTLDNDSAYNPNGIFDPDSVLKNIGFFVNQARQNGYKGLHVSGDMAWVLRGKIQPRLLMEYETKVLDYQKLTPCTAICEYDARKFKGALIMDILSVHPVILVRGQIVQNPYFISPKEFMKQYDARQVQ